jgi:hypothetical protein
MTFIYKRKRRFLSSYVGKGTHVLSSSRSNHSISQVLWPSIYDVS